MSVDWEQTFRNWSKPTSETESIKAENAESMIRNPPQTSPSAQPAPRLGSI